MGVQHNFDGQTVVVTGAGRGIGREIALHFARSNAHVFAIDRRPDGLDDLKRQSPRIQTQVAELADRLTPALVLDTAERAFGQPLSVLVNNAGLGTAYPAHAASPDDWDRSLNINLGTVFRMSAEALGRFASSGGCIVNLASIFGLVGVQGSAPYSAAKAAIIGLTRQMAADYGPRGVRINAVAPGLIVTPATAGPIADNAQFDQVLRQRTPLGRLGTPSDVAAAVAFLASTDASFITGQTLAVDGGWSTTHFQAALGGA